MKFTLSWLKEHLETTAPLEKILLALTDLGLEVEEVFNPYKTLDKFTVGEIIEAKKHPNADRLKVCRVLTNKGEKQIICGAPNARDGLKVVVAHPGDYIPGLHTSIKVGRIRGVESFGMMCSERELMISDEHEGILELDSNMEVGKRLVDLSLDLEIVVEIAITPNRPDALAVRGIARDLAARGLGKLKALRVSKIEGTFENPIKINIDREVAKSACPVFFGRYFKGIKNVESPKWLKNRLNAIGLRPISALVDITNLVTYDLARPLHVFDATKLKNDLVIRKAKPKENLLALDGEQYELDCVDTIIASGDSPVSIAGIIGGMESGCSLETTEVFLESAFFGASHIAGTGRRLRINSDARYRFERGVDPEFTEPGIEIATKLILEICGGEVSHVSSAGEVPKTKAEIFFRPERVKRLVGMNIGTVEQKRILKSLGFSIDKMKGGFSVKVPSWRPDIFGEADLIEEIVRVTSLTKLEGASLADLRRGASKSILTPIQKRISLMRRKIAGLGLNECISYSFIDHESAMVFSNNKEKEMVHLLNPISSEMNYMRPSLLPGLCSAAKRNQARSYNNLKLFEIGEVFEGPNPGQQIVQISGILVGNFVEKNAFKSERFVDVFDSKLVVYGALQEVGLETDQLLLKREGLPSYFHPGRSATVMLGHKNPLAIFGELHPKILKKFDLRGPAVAFEILAENLPYPRKKRLTRASIKISEFQPVERDFSFVIDSKCAVESVRKAIQIAEKELILEVKLFDIFEGKEAESQLGHNKKSVAFMVRLQPVKNTFTEKDLELISEKIIESVRQRVAGVLRS